MIQIDWSEWLPFPDPQKQGILIAPFGPGVYELRHQGNQQLILFGMAGHCAERMSSLLPAPHGCGTRNNAAKREYVLAHIADVEYHTVGCASEAQATEIEKVLKLNRDSYIFPT